MTELSAGKVATPLRWVLGWLFFSALWRRTVLDPSKLEVGAPGSLAEKTNHFLPHAIDPGGGLEWMLQRPEVLAVVLVLVTLAEGLAGLLLLLGLGTRLAAALVTALSAAILFSAGWLGTTCLDEWQIGVLGVAGGVVLLLAGADGFALDDVLRERLSPRARARFHWLGSGPWPPSASKRLARLAPGLALACLLLTLVTNQVFHGGLWGELHNLSARPHVEIEDARISDAELSVTLMRDEGPDTHGAFIVAMELLEADGDVALRLDGAQLSALSAERFENRYIAQVRTGPHGLVLPLGALATVRVPTAGLDPARVDRVRLVEVSGMSWEAPVRGLSRRSSRS